ncbi:hypothetical protein PN4B1_40450 [Paenibacillus naphthalenovorans]|nr:hypothetical protein PN4B1_40450 [Paenibacillus naphthalenovorans]
MIGPTMMNSDMRLWVMPIAAPTSSSGTCRLNMMAEEGWENWLTMADTIVAANTACQEPASTNNKMAATDSALSRSPAIMVRFGFHRSAKAPPMNENRKIGAYSNTVSSDTATGSLFVCSMT